MLLLPTKTTLKHSCTGSLVRYPTISVTDLNEADLKIRAHRCHELTIDFYLTCPMDIVHCLKAHTELYIFIFRKEK